MTAKKSSAKRDVTPRFKGTKPATPKPPVKKAAVKKSKAKKPPVKKAAVKKKAPKSLLDAVVGQPIKKAAVKKAPVAPPKSVDVAERLDLDVKANAVFAAIIAEQPIVGVRCVDGCWSVDAGARRDVVAELKQRIASIITVRPSGWTLRDQALRAVKRQIKALITAPSSRNDDDADEAYAEARLARLTAAKAQWAAVKEWHAAGAKGAHPAVDALEQLDAGWRERLDVNAAKAASA